MTLQEYIDEVNRRARPGDRGFTVTESVYITGGSYQTPVFVRDFDSLADYIRRIAGQDLDDMLRKRLKGLWDGDTASLSFRLGPTHYKVATMEIPIFA